MQQLQERHLFGIKKYNHSLTDAKEALVLGGDGRAASPGHSAKYGSYLVIDLKQSKVVDIKLLQV